MAKVRSVVLRDQAGNVLSATTTPAPVPSPEPPPIEPSIADMLGNFAGSMARWIAAGAPVVPHARFIERLTSCRACEHWSELARGGLGKCGHPKCGCTKGKLWLATERCPIGRWG